MTVTEYIGPLVGPVFADPAEWTPTRSYEALTIVLNAGNSYTARQDVPIGAQLNDDKYWLETGNYNAQLEAYRKQVLKYTNCMYGYTSVSAMQSDTKLEVGSIAQTAGFYRAGDGGAATYLITETGSANGIDSFTCQNGTAQLILTSWKNMRMFGAKIDGVTDDASIFNFALSKYDYLYFVGTAYFTKPIHANFDRHINFDHIKSNASDYAVYFDGGVYGKIFIDSINNPNGGAIRITSNKSDYSLIEYIDVTINNIECHGNCLDFANTDGLLDAKFNGVKWETNAGNCIDVSHMGGKTYIGQVKFNVTRCTASNGTALNLVSQNTITNIDFGYMSLEGSKLGINIDTTDGNFEPMRGVFRVVEIIQTEGSNILSFTGSTTKFMGITDFYFDLLAPDKIILNINKSAYAWKYANICLHGSFLRSSAQTDINISGYGSKAYITNNGLRCVSENVVLDGSQSKLAVGPVYALEGSEDEYILPTSWIGTPLVILNHTNKNVSITYIYLGKKLTKEIPVNWNGFAWITYDDNTAYLNIKRFN